MINLIKQVDIFGQNIKITHDSYSSVKTVVGGVMTISMVLMIVASTWFLGNDIIYKKQPIAFTQNNVSTVYDHMILNTTSLPIAVELADYASNPVFNERYLTVEMYQRSARLQSNGTMGFNVTKLELENCTRDHFPEVPEENLKSIQYEKLLCPPLNRNFKVGGDFSEPSMDYIQFRVKACNYDDPSNNCASKEEIGQHIENNTICFKIFYLNHFLITDNYEKPIGNTLEKTYDFLNSNFYFLIVDNVEKHHVYTDNGFFVSNTIETEFLIKYRSTKDLLNYSNDNKILIDYHFFATKKSFLNYRKYIKLTEIMASVGGLMKFLMQCGLILAYPISKTQLYVHLLNAFFIHSVQSPGKIKDDECQSKNRILIDNFTSSPNKLEIKTNKPSPPITPKKLVNKPITFDNTDFIRLNFITMRKKLVCAGRRNTNAGKFNFYLKCMNICNDQLDIERMFENNLRNEAFYELLLTNEQFMKFKKIKFKFNEDEKRKYPQPLLGNRMDKEELINSKLNFLLETN